MSVCNNILDVFVGINTKMAVFHFFFVSPSTTRDKTKVVLYMVGTLSSCVIVSKLVAENNDYCST